MEIETWLDESFYETGCFFPLREELKVVLGKGGFWSETPSEDKDLFQIRDFYSNELKYYHPKETITVTKDDLISSITLIDSDVKLTRPTNYQELFKKDYTLFRNQNKDLKKVVLMSRLEFKINNPKQIKKNAFHKAICTHIGSGYGFWFNEYSLIGSTPEFLFDCSKGVLRSHALAGTAQSHELEKLLKSEKDLNEHNLVVQNIIEDLGPFCNDIEKSVTDVLGYGSLIHLQTIIQGKLKKKSNSDEIILAMSPTAALGGYPRKEAKQFLLNTSYYKQFPKRYHGSTFQYTNEDTSQVIVMIRNIQIDNDNLIIEAGAGVIEQSNEESELAEIYEKISATKKILI
jgi:isochorismate synthase EntC